MSRLVVAVERASWEDQELVFEPDPFARFVGPDVALETDDGVECVEFACR